MSKVSGDSFKPNFELDGTTRIKKSRDSQVFDQAVVPAKAESSKVAKPVTAESPSSANISQYMSKIVKLAQEMGVDLSPMIPPDGEVFTGAELEKFIDKACQALGHHPPLKDKIMLRIKTLILGHKIVLGRSSDKESSYKKELLKVVEGLGKINTPIDVYLNKSSIGKLYAKLTGEKAPAGVLFAACAKLLGYKEGSMRDLNQLKELFKTSPQDAIALMEGQLKAYQIQAEGYQRFFHLEGKEGKQVALRMAQAHMQIVHVDLKRSHLEIEIKALVEKFQNPDLTDTENQELARLILGKRAELDSLPKEPSAKVMGPHNTSYELQLCGRVGSDVKGPPVIMIKGEKLGEGSFKEYFFSADDNTIQRVAFLGLKKGVDVKQELGLQLELLEAGVPHIPQILQMGPDYIVMENVDGSLHGIIKQREQEQVEHLPISMGLLSSKELIRVAFSVALCLAWMHLKRIVHLDLKPENIGANLEEGKITEVKVLDFGLAAKLDKTGKFLGSRGTPLFMAPEAYLDHVASEASDIYSYGASLFEMKYGKRFAPNGIREFHLNRKGKTVFELVVEYAKAASKDISHLKKPRGKPNLSELQKAAGFDEMDKLLFACLSPDPKKRPSAKEIARKFSASG